MWEILTAIVALLVIGVVGASISVVIVGWVILLTEVIPRWIRQFRYRG